MRRFGALATIFLGAVLLFGVQPMAGKTFLPILGGAAGVWLICLGLFQTLLVAGYLYAHLYGSGKGWSPLRVILHAGFVLCAGLVTCLWIAPNRAELIGQLPGGTLGVVYAVLLLAGIPYTLLSANSSLVQRWLSLGKNKSDVYWLYGVSNGGSLLALIGYPLLVEPFVPLLWQWRVFGIGVAIYGLSLLQFLRKPELEASPTKQEEAQDIGSQKGSIWLWLLLPATSTLLLNATTTHLLSDFSPIPLLWTITLSAFLISYMIGFTRLAEQALPILAGIALALVLLATFACSLPQDTGFLLNLLVAGGLLTLGCGFLHAWLYATRPPTQKLTLFYLCLALGGAIGGSFASFVAPNIFTSIAEYPIALILLTIGATWVLQKRFQYTWVIGLAIVIIAAIPFQHIGNDAILFSTRNVYGVSSVIKGGFGEKDSSNFHSHIFNNGATMHGAQVWDNDFYSREPTLYHGSNAIGRVIHNLPAYTNGSPVRVAILGLGAGVCTTYARKGDTYRCFEVNPQVIDIATNASYFTFISNSPANIELVEQDARLGLLEEARTNAPLYDLILIDVYAGDAIPLHLATREAFELALSRLKPDGVIALQLTNWHLDLLRICRAIRDELGVTVRAEAVKPNMFCQATLWGYISRKELPFPVAHAREVDLDRIPKVPLQSDECCSLIPYISFGVRNPPLVEKEFQLW